MESQANDGNLVNNANPVNDGNLVNELLSNVYKDIKNISLQSTQIDITNIIYCIQFRVKIAYFIQLPKYILQTINLFDNIIPRINQIKSVKTVNSNESEIIELTQLIELFEKSKSDCEKALEEYSNINTHGFNDFKSYINSYLLDKSSGSDFGFIRQMEQIWHDSVILHINCGKLTIDETSDIRKNLLKLQCILYQYDDDEWESIWPVIDNSVPVTLKLFKSLGLYNFAFNTKNNIPITYMIPKIEHNQLVGEIIEKTDYYIKKSVEYNKKLVHIEHI